MAKERTLINIPEWIAFEEAPVAPGEQYWHLTKVEYLGPQASEGLHHIYAMEPHERQVRLMVSNGQQTWEVPHTKPATEPAANFAMWANNVYTVWVNGRDVTTSDRITGLHLPLKHHVSVRLWWELSRAPADDTQGPPSRLPDDVQAALLENADANQVIQFDPEAALQKRIFADSFIPDSPEFSVQVDDNEYVAQRAEHLDTGEVRVYYAKGDNQETIHYLIRDVIEPS